MFSSWDLGIWVLTCYGRPSWYISHAERAKVKWMMLRPKDDRDLLAKKKAFETNILNFFLERASTSNFMTLQIKIISHRLWITLEKNPVLVGTPIPLGNFYLLAPPPPRNFHWPSVGGMDIFWNHTFQKFPET